MKSIKLISVFMMIFCMVFGMFCVSSAAAYNLSLQATTDGSTQATQFTQGQNLYLNIVVDNAAGVAGCAFTLNYPSDVLDAPATTSEGTPVTAGEITSIFPFTYNSTDTHRENSSESGKIYFSGAAIDTDDSDGVVGGALYDDATDHTLFTIKFTVKSDATSGNFNLSLTQTQLFNPDAGWYTDTNGNGVYDTGEDTPEPVPVLVGAVHNSHVDWNDLGLAFPVLLGDGTYPFTTVTYNVCEVVSELTYSISGTINYTGRQTGTLYVAAFETTDTGYTNPIGGQTYTWDLGTTSKAFTVSVPNGDYYLCAFIDANSFGDPPDTWEAQGEYTTTITISGANDTTSRDFSLSDPINQATGYPLFYEKWISDNSWPDIGGPNEDYDNDGYSNIQEYVNQNNPDSTSNAYDPTVKDEPGGRGYVPRVDATRSHNGYYTPGSTFEVAVQITYDGTLAALGIEETIPAGWTFVSAGGDDAPPVEPDAGTTGTLEFAWIEVPASPVEYTYIVQVPGDADGEKAFSGQVLYRREGGELIESIPGTTVQKKSFHSTDYNPGDWTISLSELLRVIQIYNVGSYHCDAAGEDGYGLGPGDETSMPHDSDYNPQDWSINLSELLRLIQIYNVGSYHVDPTGEDGYGLGPE